MKIYFVSMGCAKNTADSEHLTAQLESLGHTITEIPDGAEAAIINTCGFIQDAVKENIDAILDLEKLKEDGVIQKIIVAGCLVNRYEKELRAELSGSVDLFVRSEEWEKVISFLGGTYNANCKTVSASLTHTFWTRYLKISEGCNTLCSYCAIPSIRGKLRSIPVKQLVAEALMLCAAGAKELCLVGQDLTVYGQDIGSNLTELISTLNHELPAGIWLRLLYLHPNRVNERLIDFLLGQAHVIHYLDIPIQHSDPEILARMNRPCPEGHMRKIFSYIREQDKLFALRTTIMSGFPGESESNFGHVMDFVSDVEFDRLGVFVYSPEAGTKAAKFKDRVSRKIAEDRCTRLTSLQAQIAQERSELFLNRELEALVEEIDSEAQEAWCRSFRDAPEIDGIVCLSGESALKLKPGEKVRARIYDCNENDLFGEVI